MQGKQDYVHMLNATMCATTRVICAILETYQQEDGVKIPEALRPFMPEKYRGERLLSRLVLTSGIYWELLFLEFLPFVKEAPIDIEARKAAEKKESGKKGKDQKKK